MNQGTRFLRPVCGACWLAALAFLTADASAQVEDVPGWRLVWHDEFDGPGLDTTKWVPLNRRNSFNNEKQYYHPDQVEVVDGELRLTAIDTSRSGKAYQSGLVTSSDLFGPGRFEARIDLPTSQGMWPAFWLNANQVQWPLGGEIDIMENRGSQSTVVSSAYHWQTNPGPCCDQRQFVFHEHREREEDGLHRDFHETFNTYTVEWEESELRFYVNGNLHLTVIEQPNRPIIETAKYIILNLAVGGTFGGDSDDTTAWPQTMHIDYVRVWKRQTGTQGDYNADGVVDNADYTVWRDSQGESGIGLPADGSGNGTVDQADFDIWKANFGGETPTSAVRKPSGGLQALSGAAVTITNSRDSGG